MSRKKILFLGIFLSWFNLQAQEVPQIIPPSPEAAAFSKYGDIPVNTYTGVTNIDIPVYQIRSRDISIPISLSYHASGIKVNEEASWVGLGWTLNAGGIISRMVMGEDDFANHSGGYHNNPQIADIEHLPTGSTWGGTFFISEACVATIPDVDCEGTTYLRRNSGYDFEPDQYNYNFPEGSGKFILKRNKEAVHAKKDKIEIKYLDASQSWRIRTAEGYSYFFEEYEITQDQHGDPVKTAWYLTKIISPTKEEVTFQYIKETTYNLITIGEVTEQKAHQVQECQPFSNGYLNPVQRSYTSVTLSAIDFKNGQVVFDFNNNRSDINGGKRLNAIKVFKKDEGGNLLSQPFKQFDFDYSYFVGGTDIDYNFNVADPNYLSYRLKLESITEKSGSLANPPYQFYYYEGGNNTLPSKASFARDYWGYYNGALSNQSLIPAFVGFLDYGAGPQYDELPGANREPNASYMQAFTLKEIEYPTGGKTQFFYEAHDYDKINSEINNLSPEGSEPTLKQKLATFTGIIGQTVIEELDISNSNESTVHITLDATFHCINTNGCSEVGAQEGEIYFQLFYDAAGTNPVAETNVDFTDGTAETTCSLSSESFCQRTYIYDLPPGKYYWKGYIGNVSNFDGMTANYTWYEVISPEDQVDDNLPIAGGLRIKEIIDHDGINIANDITRKFVYNYWEDIDNDGVDEKKSYGRLMTKPLHERIDVDVKNDGTGVGCLIFVRLGNSSVPLNGTLGGTAVGYDKVTILYGKGATEEFGINGKTEFEYENNPVVVYDYDKTRIPGILNINMNSNGLLKHQVDYKSTPSGAYQKVREIFNEYQLVSMSLLRHPETYVNDNKSEIYYGIRIDKLLNNVNDNGFFLYFYPAIHSEWVRQLSSTEKVYDLNDPTKFVERITSYEYETTPVHYQVKRTTAEDSKGKVIATEYTYPADPGSGAPSAMWNENDPNYQHMHSQIVDKKVRRNGNLIAQTVNNYAVVATNEGKPIYAPQSIDNYPSGTNEKITVLLTYDNEGKIITTQKQDDLKTAYLWGYGQSLPVVQVVNANRNQIYYEGFENSGKELKDGVDNHLAKTGNKVKNSGAHTINFSAPDNQQYILSYWYWNGSKWEYMETNYTGPKTYTSPGNQLDELRVFPKGALMTTYTYDPLIGITSVCDPNNIVTYYKYDDLGRLKVIKDNQQNLLQKYEYNYRTE